MRTIDIGKQYPRGTPVARVEFDLNDLYWLQSLVPHSDGFYKDIQEAIEFLEGATRDDS